MNYCTELLILKLNFQTATEEHILEVYSYTSYLLYYLCIILNDDNESKQNASKRKMLDKNEAALRNTGKTKTDVYEICGVIERFNYEKSYAEFSVSSEKEVGSNFPV